MSADLEHNHLPPQFWQGIEEFNQREYYACHDTLEAIWMEANEPQKTFYQGILQVSVALYHLGNQNLRGAMILLGEGIGKLSRYQPDYETIEVTDLIIQSQDLLKYLQQVYSENITSVDLESLPKIEIKTIE